ncbi:unnamed protein product, partial [marine sediment metagenome]
HGDYSVHYGQVRRYTGKDIHKHLAEDIIPYIVAVIIKPESIRDYAEHVLYSSSEDRKRMGL